MTNKTSVTGKEPWLAVILSTLFPGIGQIYAGKTLRGLIFILVGLSLIAIGGWLILSPTGSVWLGFQLLIGFALFVIFSLFDAHRCTRKVNNSEFEILRKEGKDPWLAVFLSRIIPGLGHAYQGQWLFAILFFILIIGFGGLSAVFPLISVVAISLLYVCFYHAYISSPTPRAKSQRLIIGVCIALLAVNLLNEFVGFSIREFVAETRYIPSESMMPTLQVNDRLIVDKLQYQDNLPQRKDIVIFNPTPALEQEGFQSAFIQRIIGLPEETVEVKSGKVYINSQPLEEDYILEPPQYEYGPTQVPPNSYFVLGDNRNNSYDSQYWGFFTTR